MIAELARSPSRPRTYLVNPRYPDIGGRPCLPSLAEVPEPVDLVLLAVPDTRLEDQLALAARTKARSAVIFGNAFEIFSERAVVLPPVTRSSARVVLAGLRLAAVLAGARGQRPADLDSIAGAIAGLSELAADLGDLLDALDINPLICGPSGAVAADVLAVVRR